MYNRKHVLNERQEGELCRTDVSDASESGWTLTGQGIYSRLIKRISTQVSIVRDAHNQCNRNQPINFDYYKTAAPDSD